MSFITAPKANVVTPAQTVAALKARGSALLAQMNAYASDAIKAIWMSDSPQAVLDAMGPDGASAMTQHKKLVAFLADPEIATPVAASVLALAKPTAADAGGKVTIAPHVTPPP